MFDLMSPFEVEPAGVEGPVGTGTDHSYLYSAQSLLRQGTQ